MQKEKWHIKTIKNFFLENKYNTLSAVFVSLCFVAWYVVTDNVFIWRTYEPIPDPVFTARILSAITFGTLGLFLYNTKVYQFFYNLLPYKSFVEFKKIIWGVMSLFIGYVVIPWTVDLANMVLSFIFNIIGFILWLFPPIGVPVIVFALFYWIKKLWS